MPISLQFAQLALHLILMWRPLLQLYLLSRFPQCPHVQGPIPLWFQFLLHEISSTISNVFRRTDCPDCLPGLQMVFMAGWLSTYMMHLLLLAILLNTSRARYIAVSSAAYTLCVLSVPIYSFLTISGWGSILQRQFGCQFLSHLYISGLYALQYDAWKPLCCKVS